MINEIKLFRRALCKVVGHDWDEDFVCSRCKKLRRYEDFTVEELDNGNGIPHKVVMDYMRRKYINILPPTQQDIDESKPES